MSDEIYHLQVEGEQRGPYTRRQIDHQLNSGIIPVSTLFVREGMEDWQPVTQLVTLRRAKRRWRTRPVLVAFLLLLLVMAHFLGPVALEGWRETAQFHFTESAAYWRAREAVRHQALSPLAVVRFGELSSARVVLDPAASGALVRLPGEITPEHGHGEAHAWNVTLDFDPTLKQWTATSVAEEAKEPQP